MANITTNLIFDNDESEENIVLSDGNLLDTILIDKAMSVLRILTGKSLDEIGKSEDKFNSILDDISGHNKQKIWDKDSIGELSNWIHNIDVSENELYSNLVLAVAKHLGDKIVSESIMFEWNKKNK